MVWVVYNVEPSRQFSVMQIGWRASYIGKAARMDHEH